MSSLLESIENAKKQSAFKTVSDSHSLQGHNSIAKIIFHSWPDYNRERQCLIACFFIIYILYMPTTVLNHLIHYCRVTVLVYLYSMDKFLYSITV